MNSMYFNAVLYVSIAVVGALASTFGSDEAAKWVEASWLFWIRTFFTAVGAGLLALKMFLSTSYSEHLAEKKKTGDTVLITKP